MPIEPRQGGGIIPQILSSLIQRRQGEEEEDRRRAERDQQREMQLEEELVKTAVEQYGAGTKELTALAPTLKHMRPERLNAYGTLGDMRRKKAKEEERAAEATNPQQLTQLGQQMAPQAGPSGALAPPPREIATAAGGELSRRHAELMTLGREDLVPQLYAGASGAMRQQELAGREVVATEKRGEAEAQRAVGAQDFRANRDRLTAAEAAAQAAAHEGLLPDFDVTREASIARLEEAGLPHQAAVDAARRAEQLARGEQAGLRERQQSVTGKKPEQQRFEDRVEELREEFPALSQDPTLERNVRQEIAGVKALDPWSRKHGEPVFLDMSSVKDRDRYMEQRKDLLELDEQYQNLMAAYTDLNDSRERGELAGGPFQSATMYDILAFAGKQPGPVAAYRRASFDLITSILKAKQGAKVSDFDLKMYLAQMPLLSEVGTDSANVKIESFSKMLNAQRYAPIASRGGEKAIMRVRRIADRIPTGKLNSAAAMMEKELADTGTVSEATLKTFIDEAQRFSSSPQADRLRSLMNENGLAPSGDALAPDEQFFNKVK